MGQMLVLAPRRPGPRKQGKQGTHMHEPIAARKSPGCPAGAATRVEEMSMSDGGFSNAAGGMFGKVVGKAKTVIGSLSGKDDLEREGRLQQAQVQAEEDTRRREEEAALRRREVTISGEQAATIAERDRLRVDIEAEDRQARIDAAAQQREAELYGAAALQDALIQEREEQRLRSAEQAATEAVDRRAADAAQAAQLRRLADQRDRTADAIEPEEQ